MLLGYNWRNTNIVLLCYKSYTFWDESYSLSHPNTPSALWWQFPQKIYYNLPNRLKKSRFGRLQTKIEAKIIVFLQDQDYYRGLKYGRFHTIRMVSKWNFHIIPIYCISLPQIARHCHANWIGDTMLKSSRAMPL